ncbi:branched-chain amino acid ABC transporter substrate-binding protein [Herbaspirillum sp. RV1423]|uniref:branched-chain amino acid ABC transporter substrate-binding protein n=1 Tax=Herbaspirillum sp. RV1423 TaxID=1443993 RepID=UPI0004AD1650|nr:branched-chain amino acid ABC transporter substrate-binding protein [Herbaspirillum sp. RV1423]
MKLMLCSFQLAFLLLAAPLASMASVAKEAAKEKEMQIVLIGYAGPLSGTSAGVGKSMANAVQLAIDEANRHGLQIQGKPVQLQALIQDDRTNPRTAEFVAHYLVKSGVIGVIGHWNSAASLAAAPIYNAAGVIQISPATMSTLYTQQGNRAVFRTIGNNGSAGSYTADYAVKSLQARRFLVVDDGTPFGRGFAEQFSRSAKDNGAQIVGSHSVSDKTSDFNAVLADVARLRPDAVLFGGLDMQASTLARSLKRRNPETRFIGASGTVGLPFLRAAGADGNGSIVLEPGLPMDKMPGWKSFEKNYMQKFDSNIDLYAPFAYDATQVLIAAMRQANSVEPKRVAEVLHEIRFNGMTGTISFNQDGDLNNPTFTIYEVQNQSWVVKKVISGSAN